MPAGDGRRLDQYQRLAPPRPHSSQAHPEQAVKEAEASIGTRENAELVVEREDLDQEVPPGPEGRAHPVCDGQNNLTHRVSVSPAASRTSTILSGRDYGELQVCDVRACETTTD
jgi:hypothetical protein